MTWYETSFMSEWWVTNKKGKQFYAQNSSSFPMIYRLWLLDEDENWWKSVSARKRIVNLAYNHVKFIVNVPLIADSDSSGEIVDKISF